MTSPLPDGLVLGIDPSLNSTGLITLQRSAPTEPLDERVLRPGKLRGMERLFALSSMLREQLRAHPYALVVLEGYAFAAKGRAHATGEWGALIRADLYALGIPTLIVPPTTLKLYAAGKGNAAKHEVMGAVAERWGYAPGDDNLSDAYALARLGASWGTTGGEETEERIMSACEWLE